MVNQDPVLGFIESFDRSFARGVIRSDFSTIGFSSTAFYGRKRPRVGDDVKVIYSGSEVLAVLLEGPRA